jgi:uroporphyrinogen III methyltransferase/synthase
MKPLAGRRVVVTRPRARAGELIECLTTLGAVPILLSAIETVPNSDSAALDTARAHLNRYDWVVFTSAAGVAAFWELPTPLTTQFAQIVAVPAARRSHTPSLPYLHTDQHASPRFAAVGPATALALRQRGFTPAFIPDDFTAAALAAGLPLRPGHRILLPLAEIAGDTLARTLRERGATVDLLAAYTTRLAAPDPVGLAELQRGVDAITFTSVSTVRGFVHWQVPLGAAVVACLGPQTAQAVQAAGLPVHLIAPAHTAAALAEALARHFAALTQSQGSYP